ncbi:MAG: hypothetical protein ACC662_01815, partial [Planctomycetota bacterium]
TPGKIALATTTVLTAAGGTGGPTSTTSPPPFNRGGAGSVGRIVLEDGDSVVTGLSKASVTPGEGNRGFYRGSFDPTRFADAPDAVALTQPFFLGPLEPVLLDPVPSDFVAGVPAVSAVGHGHTAILLEARGLPIRADGLPDTAAATGWVTVGYFEDISAPTAPRWVASTQPPDMTPAADNTGVGLATLNLPAGGSPYLQVRLTFRLADDVGPSDPGPWLDHWGIRFDYDR